MKINNQKSNKTERANTTQNETKKKATEIPLSSSSVGQLLLDMGPALKHGCYAQ